MWHTCNYSTLQQHFATVLVKILQWEHCPFPNKKEKVIIVSSGKTIKSKFVRWLVTDFKHFMIIYCKLIIWYTGTLLRLVHTDAQRRSDATAMRTLRTRDVWILNSVFVIWHYLAIFCHLAEHLLLNKNSCWTFLDSQKSQIRSSEILKRKEYQGAGYCELFRPRGLGVSEGVIVFFG